MKRKELKRQNKNKSMRSKQLEARGVSMDMETSWAAQELASTFDLDNMARFQQKQLQEKEQKLLQLYDQQQQRAYQVVQRGSAGSNGSNHGSSINQHTVTKTTTTSHTTSTSQGGKVRQMFDERRQTTVKGIDRSYPLEPLENKPRKQTNGNVAQKNGNLTVNRQSVTVKRVARADVNSNLNGGKPIVSYHEEITRESYGPGGRQQSDDDEFGNENHINQYANGNQTHIEEVLNDDTIERNRMMAKLHLMEYDETLKHRVKNDLESEEFPEDFMVDVPDKLPKQSVSKKLSQAEARLERFKHANAKRSNSLTKNPSNVLKKRSDPILPVKSTSSEDQGRARIRAGSSSRGSRNIGRSIKNASLGDTKETSLSFSWKNENPRFFYKRTETATDSKGDDEGIGKTRRSASPKFFCKESDTSATTYAIDSKTREKLSPEFTNIKRRSDSPKLFDSKSTNQLSLKDRAKRSESPKFFCKESDKSATTYAIDSRTREKLSPEFTRNMRPSSPSSKTTTKAVDKIRRSESPKFFCKESERSATTYAIDSKTRGKLSSEFTKDIKKRSDTPKFFCKESEKSATTYAIDSKTREKLSPEYSKGSKQRSESPISSGKLSPEFSRIIKKRSESPKFFCKESERSATTYAIDSKTREKLSPEYSKGSKQRSESPISSGKLSPEFSRIITKRSDSPKFFCKESERSATTYAIDSKTREKLSPEYSKGSRQRSESPSSSGKLSPEFSRIITKRSDSPKFFCKESEKSATTYAIDSKTREKSSSEFSRSIKKRSESPKFNRKGSEKSATAKDARRSESPKFFCRESEKSATTYAIDSRSRSTSPDFIKLRPTFKVNMPINPSINIGTVDRQINHKSKDMAQTFSPKAYQKQETELNSKSAQNRMPNVFERLTRRGSSPKCLQSNTQDTKFPKSADITRKIPRESADSKSVDLTRKLSGRSSTSPQFFTSDSERSATIMLVTPETIVKRKPEPLKVDKTEEASKTRDIFIVEPARRMSEEIIDESSKHNIRSSVSRFFSEQCAKASRNPEDGTIDKVQSVEGGWSRDSSPLSLRDTRTSPRSAEFSGTSADSIRDWSSKSKRNGGHLSREFLENKSNRDSIKNDSIKESTRISLRKSKSPDVDRRSTNVLRSTRLIRDAINRQDNTIEKDQGSRRSRRNEAGISIGADSRKKVETCGKVGRSRTTGEVRETGSSPKSFASAEVDAEIQEITMPDQYVERRPREVNAKSRDKTRRSSAEKLLTYSVRKPERKRGSLFESSVLKLSKRDQEKTDRRETSGKERKYTVKTQNNPSPTNNFTFRCSRRKINEDSQSRGERALDEDDGFKCSEGNWSSSPSPTSNFTSYTSKAEMKGNKGVNRKIGADIFHSRERKVLDEYDKRSFSSSPPPINLATRKMNRRIEVERLRSKEGTVNSVRSNATRRLLDDYNKEKSDIKSSSPSPTICITKTKNITKQDSRMKSLNSQGKKILNKSNDLVIPGSKRRIAETGVTQKILHRKTPSPVQSKQKKSSSKPSQILRSMELVRKVITGGRLPIDETKDSIENKETRINKSDSTGKSSSTIVYINGESSNYERTDSVESALKRFDSIGTESVQSEKRQTVEESKAISLKALDRIDANLSENLNRQPSLRKSPAVSVEMDRNQSNAKCGRKFARARDSIEIARIVTGSKSAACKRKLFQDDSGEETETSSLDSSGKYLRSDSRTKKMLVNNGETHESSLSVKQLRSIEDIRKSIEPCFEARGSSTKSAIANDTLKLKRLPRRSENFGRTKDALGDAERSAIKCAIRFSRVTKSPSPDSKTTENRARRNVLSSPSKSPDIVARRSSTEMKAQETRSTKRPTLMKGAEPIGNRKTTPTSTTTTSTRKSTDVVDGAILENGVHLRDQTAETKYDNDSAATKKSSAFVIDFDEQPPKENDAPLPRKSLLRKQSTDKQTPSTQTGRPPSSISSTSSGSSMQGQVSGIKGKMASKAKTPTSGATHRASAGSKSGGSAVVADRLVPCKMCGRRFAQDRVTLHEQICTKTTQKKRKQFDTMMYRVKGTDLEPFVKKGLCKKQPEKSKKPEPKSNWRRKHEDFINAIRSAKQVQAHLAAGGKLSDLPPPPASDTSDYIQCPHCGRKFNQSAAERHIPKCEHMLHNKPIHARAPKPKR